MSIQMRSQVGFSLIELVITVVIVAIMATIALPYYRDYLIRTNRVVGKRALLEVAARQEQYFSNHDAYAASLTMLGYPDNPYLVNDRGEALEITKTSEGIYAVSLSVAGGGLEYSLTAIPQGRQNDDLACGTLAINYLGQQFEVDGVTRATEKCW